MIRKTTTVVILLCLLATQGCKATEREALVEARLKLKNYGFAYCMKENTTDKNSQPYLDYTRAGSAYLQTGSHSFATYNKVAFFIDENYVQSAFKGYEGDNIFISCLKLYNSPSYEHYIEQLDTDTYALDEK